MNLFIQLAADQNTRFFYFAWILAMTISIVLHELAHGWMAWRCGDDTPYRLGRMTGNPLVQMGPFSLAALFLFGIAWGQMPIDPTRMRGRYAEAIVSFAGPAVNLALAAAAMLSLGLIYRFASVPESNWQQNLEVLLHVTASGNLILFVFNMLPIPPLDGSHILANFSRRYALFFDDPAHQGVAIMGFFFAFALVGVIQSPLIQLTRHVIDFVATVGH